MTGLVSPITGISLLVRDLDARIAAYQEAFGWGPWTRFASAGGPLHDFRIRDAPVDDFRVRFAQARVDELVVELVEPLGGPGPWQDALEAHGEGIDSIALTFPTREEAERLRSGFARLGIGVLASARIGDTGEWYLLDSEAAFKCRIASGTGHAIDLAAR